MSTDEQEQAEQTDWRKRPRLVSIKLSDGRTTRGARISNGYGRAVDVADTDILYLIALLARHWRGEELWPVAQYPVDALVSDSERSIAKEDVDQQLRPLIERRRQVRAAMAERNITLLDDTPPWEEPWSPPDTRT